MIEKYLILGLGGLFFVFLLLMVVFDKWTPMMETILKVIRGSGV